MSTSGKMAVRELFHFQQLSMTTPLSLTPRVCSLSLNWMKISLTSSKDSPRVNFQCRICPPSPITIKTHLNSLIHFQSLSFRKPILAALLNVWSQNIQTEVLLAMSSRNNLPKREVYEQNTSVIALTCEKGKED